MSPDDARAIFAECQNALGTKLGSPDNLSLLPFIHEPEITYIFIYNNFYFSFLLFSRLVVCSNNISTKGLCALGNCLKMNSSLRKLYIWGNTLLEPACKVKKHR